MPQKYTEAKKNGNRKWDAENLDRVSIALPKGMKDRVKAEAAAAGLSMNAYITRVLSGELLPAYCVRYTVTDSQREKLDSLTAEYSRKVGAVTAPELFETMMFNGSRNDIEDRLEAYRSMLERTPEKEGKPHEN